jgi:hypothetical protein
VAPAGRARGAFNLNIAVLGAKGAG